MQQVHVILNYFLPLERITNIILTAILLGIGIIPVTAIVAAQESDVYIIKPSFQNLQQEKVREVEPGHPVMLHFDVHNNRADARSEVVVFEVRDSDDFTVYLGWQTVTIGPNGDSAMAVSWIPASWTPSESGEYVIRTFALRGIEGDDVQSWSQIYESGQLFVNPD